MTTDCEFVLFVCDVSSVQSERFHAGYHAHKSKSHGTLSWMMFRLKIGAPADVVTDSDY